MAKTELEEAGLETEGMVESTAKLRQEILALSGIDIMEDADTFKSTYAIMDELAAKWKDLTDIQQASVTELIAGKRQGNIVSSLMTNFDTAREALETSLNSSGSAMREHEKWQQSLEAQINKLKASWQSLSQAFLKSDFLKTALNVVIGLVDGLTGLIDTFGTLPTLLGTVAAGFSLFKNKGLFTFDKDVKSIQLFGTQLTGLKDKYAQIHTAISRYNSLSSQSASFQEKYNKVMAGSNTSIGKYLSGLNGAKASFTGYIGSLVGATVKTIALEAATMLLNTALTMGVSLIIQGVVTAITKWINAEKELAEKVEEVTSKFKEQQSELIKNKSSFESEAKRYAQLSKGVDGLGRNVSLTADEYSEYQSIVNSIADQTPALVAGYDSQGNAILNVKGSVEELTIAYENLIKAQNNEVLTQSGNIIKDFKNKVEDNDNQGFWKQAATNIGLGALLDYNMTTDSARVLNKLLNAEANGDDVDKIINAINSDAYLNGEIRTALENAGVEMGFLGEGFTNALKKTLENEPEKIKGIIDDFNAEVADDIGQMAAIAQATISQAFDISDSDYANMSDGLQSIAKQIVNNFDYDFYSSLLNNDKYNGDVGRYINDMLDAFNQMSNADVSQLEASFNLKTQFNNNDISYGEYVHGLENVGGLIEGLNLNDEVESQLRLNLGLNENGLVKEYQTLLNRITETSKDKISSGNVIGLELEEAKEFLDSLSSEELSVVTKVVPDFEPISTEKIKEEFDKLEEGGSVDLTLRPEVDTSILKDAGWKDAGEGAATVFTNTFSNAAGDVAMNFTPIVVDENGKHIDTLSPEALEKYAEGVINGAEDVKGLKIGATFEGGDAIAQAVTAAKRIHQLQDYYYNGTSAQLYGAIDRMLAVQGLLTDFDIKIETAGIEALNTALAESKSATGLTVESIDALKARYEDLDGYNVATLFEETANGIRLNSTELAKLESEYKKVNKQDLDETLEKLVEEYNELTVEIDNCSDASKRADLYAQRDSIIDQINDTATLAAQYEGLTSAYNEWLSAQEAGQDRDQYESIISGREEIEDEMSRGWLDDAAVKYLELLSGQELSTAGIDAQIAAYKELDKTIGNSKYSIWDFFTEDDDGNTTSNGVYNFFDTVKSVAGETAAWVDENGAYHFDFEGFSYNGKTGDSAIAEILGTSEELVQIMLKAAEDAGFVINIEGDYTDLANFKEEAEKVNDRMKELSATTYTFDFDSTNIDNLNEQISEAKMMLSNLKNEDGTLKVGVSEEDYRQAQDLIGALIYQKQSLDDSAILHVDTTQAQSDIENAILKLQEFRTYTNTLELETAIGADTSEAITNIQSVLDYINGLDTNIKAGLGLDTTEVQTAINNVQANIQAGIAIKQEDLDIVNAAISSISNDMMVELGLDTTLIDNYKSTEQTAKGTVNWDNNIEKVTAWINQAHEASGTVKWNNNTDNVRTTFFGNGVINWTVSEANGTANAHGTAFARGSAGGKAYKQGDWGIKGNGTALGGELGTEILVRDGRWYTIGDSGAEFFNYKKGDIIFNHKQTEELFANGKVTSGGGRGKAFANGSAFASGSTGSGNLKSTIKSAIKEANKETSSKKDKDSSNGSTGSNGSGSTKNAIKNATKSFSSSTKSTKDDFEETFDWVEIAISRIERAIDQLDQTASATYKSWSTRNNALTKEIGKVGEEIDLQEKAYNRYMQEANSVGLSESWKKKVQNGTVDISTIKDEGLAEKIKEYQKWYELALQTKDAVQDLKDKESELYIQRFDNIAAKYEAKLNDIENQKSIVEENIKQSDYDTSVEDLSNEDYKSIIALEKKSIAQLKAQKKELEASLAKAVEDGTIEKYSEEWYTMKSTIDEVALGIEQSTTNILTSYEEMFDGIAEKYNSTIGLFDSEKSISEIRNERSKYDTSVNSLNNDNYDDIITQETNTYNTLAQQKREQEDALKDLEKNGYTKGSKKWNEKKAEINNTTLQMEQAALNISNAYSDMFDNVSVKYDGILQGFEHTETMLNEYISQAETDGHIISTKYYQALADNEEGNISSLKSKQAELITARDKAVEDGKVTKYSQEWYRMCGEIDNVTQAIENGTTKLKEYDKAMRQIEWDKFDMKQEHISDVTAESDFMIKLMSSKDMHDDKGNLTAQGAATLGLHGLNHNTYMYQADEYAKEIADIDRRTKLDKNDEDYLDPNSKDVINRRRELVKLQQDSILAAEGEKQAIKDLVEEGINKELDALQELIDKKNEALQSEKDLYEYQKKVKEQTEEIASLEKQIAAYENDSSEEAKAKIQELKVSLEDAEENLRESEWDKYIQDTSALLDSLYTEYETILNTRLDNIDDLLSQVVSGINASMGEGGTIDTALGSEGAIATAIANTVSENGGMKTILNTELGAVGTTLSTEMDKIWTTEGTGTNAVLATYGAGFQSKQTTTNETLSGIKTKVDEMVEDSDEEADDKTNDDKTSPSSEKDPTGDNNKKDPPKKDPPKKDPPKKEPPKKDPPKKKTSGDGAAKVGDKVKFISGKYYYDSEGKSPIGSKNLGKEVYITNINTKSWATHPYHISTGKTLGKGDLGWLKLNQISGYATGKKKVSDSQYAWTQENGLEYIVRPSDGAILTPVAKGDSVLNATASGNIWSMANNPTEFIKNNLGLDAANVPSGVNVQSNYTQHLDKVVFNLPNVKNYDELLAAMQKDKNFERLILSMSIDRLAGKSGLAKGKSIR